MKTKIFTLLVVATMFTTQCLYAYDALIDGIAYNLNEAEFTAEVTSLMYPDKYSGDIIIPATINYSSKNYSVTSIESYAFSDCTGLTSINIPNSVTNIDSRSFSFCTGLNSIVIELGNPVYDSRDNCNAIIETATNTLIRGCNNTNIPQSITNIGYFAFDGCSGLTSITIPNSVTSIGYEAFRDCSGLISIYIPKNVKTSGSQYDKGNRILYNGSRNLKSITIESPIGSMFDCFADSNTVYKVENLKVLSDFIYVKETQLVQCPKSVQNINILGGELSEIAFAVINRNYKTLKTLDIENADNTELSDEAIKGCYNLENLKLPKNLTKIGYMAMAECMALKEVNIPSSVTEIGDRAFENCRSMKTITFGSGSAMKTAEESQLQRIGNWSFYNCHELQNLDIPEGVTEIGLAAFYGCTYLQNLTLPSTLRTIGDNTFAKCEKLAGLRCAAEVPPTIDAKTFEDVDRTIPVTVPQGSLKAYKEDMYWSEFINLKEETTDAKEIPAEFENIGIVDGTVTYSGNEPFSIHNLNGQDVTNLNGSLNGIHVITIGTASRNMLIK